jgi:hypothetical protein
LSESASDRRLKDVVATVNSRVKEHSTFYRKDRTAESNAYKSAFSKLM